jgi:pyruvate/2-oxoglutarate/acetoin dehydrogenase E1 component
MCGRRPIAEILFSDFLTTVMDPIVNQAAKLRFVSGGQYSVPMALRTPGGAGLAMAAQHRQSLEALLTGIPSLIIIAPSCPADAKGLLKAAIRSSNPVLFCENKLLYLEVGEIPDGEFLVPIGRADVKRSGRDATVVAVGGMVPVGLESAATLAAEGIEVEVVDPRTLVPLDLAAIVGSVARTGRLVTVEEGADHARLRRRDRRPGHRDRPGAARGAGAAGGRTRHPDRLRPRARACDGARRGSDRGGGAGGGGVNAVTGGRGH